MTKSRFFKFALATVDERKLTDGKARSRSADDKARRVYLQRARIRCREFMELRYCAACHHTLEAIHSFCDQCDQATEPLPAAYALEYARAEFPDLVETREDFDSVVA